MYLQFRKVIIFFIFQLFYSILIFLISCDKETKYLSNVKIGIALPMNYESYGVAPLNGIKLALGEINNKIKEREVKLIVRDTNALPSLGTTIINEFSSIGIQVIIGAAASRAFCK